MRVAAGMGGPKEHARREAGAVPPAVQPCQQVPVLPTPRGGAGTHRALAALEDLPGLLQGAALLLALSLQGAGPQLLQQPVGTPSPVQDAVGFLLGDED